MKRINKYYRYGADVEYIYEYPRVYIWFLSIRIYTIYPTEYNIIKLQSDGSSYSEASYKNNNIHGVERGFYMNGNVRYERDYVNDIYREYYENIRKIGSRHIHGNIEHKYRWRERPRGVRCVVKNGCIYGDVKSEHKYKNGVAHGLCKDFYVNGNIKCEFNSINGMKHGIYREYYDKSRKLTHNNKTLIYHGGIKFERRFDNGMCVGERYFKKS